MLKQLRLQKSIQLKRSALSELDFASIEKREAELAAALDEAETEEDINLVEGEIEELEADKKELEEKKSALESEIEGLQKELDEIPEPGEKKEERKEERKIMTRQANGYFERSEVKYFYEQFRNMRSVGGAELTIPDVTVNRIFDIVGDYSTLYPLVDKIKIKGEGRILFDTDTTAAEWMEMTDPIPEGDVGTIGYVDFDGFKVGKITFVDNSILQDSIINLDAYVTKKIARAIALAIDKAILKGAGSTSKQPTGIIPSLESTHNVEADPADGIAAIISPISLIDTGADTVGEIVAVMNRKTYYDKLLPFSILPTDAGNLVGKLPNLTNPDLLGLRVVFNNEMGADEILYGDFSKYTLVERESVTIDTSIHAKFGADKTAFRGKARFDGKPVDKNAFVLVSIGETVNP